MSRLFSHIRRRSSTHRPKPPIPRRLYVISDSSTFDCASLRRLETEGFSVEYVPFRAESDDIDRDRRELERIVHEREDDLEPGERYAIVAFNRPAYLLILSHHQSSSTNPFPRLCALIAFYPDAPQFASLNSSEPARLPPSTTAASTSTSMAFQSDANLAIQIHLAGSRNESFAMWDDSNKRHRCHLLFYPESQPGFAESAASSTYDRTSSRLAWSRSLNCLKRGFGWPCGGGNWGAPDPELVWEGYWRNIHESAKYPSSTSSPDMLSLMVGGGAGNREFDDQTCVNCVPSGVGGSSPSEITTFYSTSFVPSGPPSQRIRLLSRTSGADRVVDELLLTFEHTEEIPWMLPGVPPTGRYVRIPLIMTAGFLGGKIANHNIYWDQASVLVQIGLLDPTLIPPSFKTTGPNREGKDTIERMPVVGEEAASRVLY